ncbi:MAG: polyphosphate kinase 1 [Verrucomicrobiales bacterium]|jgi:polyphosphate kinase|nr:polyphosphate kinase 1 [Verrucomicrobiales bacterium]
MSAESAYLPEHFTNRELSWLQFNARVLEEARDSRNPLLERVKFLCITSSNLDEFFEIRVAGLKQLIESNANDPGPDGLGSQETFNRIHRRVRELIAEQDTLWLDVLKPELEQNGIYFHELSDLPASQQQWLEEYFIKECYPVLTPLAIDPSHLFPQLLNKSLNIIVMLERQDGTLADSGTGGELRYGIVQVPRILNRLVTLPDSPAGEHHFVYLSRLIGAQAGKLFPGLKVRGAHAFRITRNSDLYFDDEEAQNLLRSIEEELRKRNRGNAVRLEISNQCPESVQHFLLEKFKLGPADLYPVCEPINFLRLMPVTEISAKPALRYKAFSPAIVTPLQGEPDIFEIMRHQDILLHHPYHNFSSIVEFVETAAVDATVLAIKMTLYRTSGDSPLIKALIHAANNGKQVTAMIELKARFDEANNIAWARRMEDAGIHVVYGLVGLKTHCKLLFIVRRDPDGIRNYVHLGTGNYHPRTARLYTDLGLLTTRPEITREVAELFNALTGMSEYTGAQNLLIAPFDMKPRFLEKIRREAAHASRGKPAYLFAKMNALVDTEIIEALYDASKAGVKIDLLVRGICCLKPRVPGLSDNIEVRSIVDQFLEHSRIFYFKNDAADEVYLGSADWMPRNLHRRVEVVFPVEDPKLKQQLIENIIATYWQDNAKARYLQSDGLTDRRDNRDDVEKIRAQSVFMRVAEKERSLAPMAVHPPEREIMPIDAEEI